MSIQSEVIDKTISYTLDNQLGPEHQFWSFILQL